MSKLTPVQQRLLEIMKWYHAYCVENHLTYYMIGGTMLGAVRHKGFIPWDDDIDVGMPRDDYERFISLMHEKPNEIYCVETYRDGRKDFTAPFAKLYDTTTTLIEVHRRLLRRGLFIDVFPLDGVDSSEKWNSGYRRFRLYKNILSVLNARMHSEYSAKLNVLIALSVMIPFKDNLRRELQIRIDKFCSSARFDVNGKVANLVGSRKEREILPGCFFGKPILYTFEGLEFYGVERADEYLSALVGDYMQLPPENERRGHLTGGCDLNNGYKS